VIAHEVGHHVQKLLGTSDKVAAMQGRSDYNEYSVRLELQADFYAGVWANHSKQHLDHGDIEEAMRAANAIGDDAIQKQSQGRVVPHAFTMAPPRNGCVGSKKARQRQDRGRRYVLNAVSEFVNLEGENRNHEKHERSRTSESLAQRTNSSNGLLVDLLDLLNLVFFVFLVGHISVFRVKHRTRDRVSGGRCADPRVNALGHVR
jgi:hypothetical protein